MNTLLQQFLEQEVTSYVQALVVQTMTGLNGSTYRRKFEFDRFEVALDFENASVLLEDVLDVGPDGSEVIAMADFERSLKALNPAR